MTDERQHRFRDQTMPTTLSDEDLMLQVRDGVGEMLGVLFQRYQQPLFSFYCRLTGDRVLSEDLVQDVFYRILRYRHTYKPGSSFRTWMYQVARNARLDSVMKKSAQAEVEMEEDFEPPAQQKTAAEVAIDKQQNVLLRRALLRLPEEKRELLLLSRFQEMPYEEIGKLLGIETGTVKVRVFRAVQELREVLYKMEGKPRLQQGC